MTSKWKILAPIDLSQRNEDVVQYALSAAAALGADLHLLHVIDGETFHSVAQCWPANAFSADGGDVQVFRTVLQGPAAATIAKYADSIDADVIVMTTGRYGKWNTFWRKSVTEGVMRISRRPILIASATTTDGDFRFRNSRFICLPGLENAGDTTLLQHADMIAERTKSSVVLLHVVPEPSEAFLHRAASGSSRPLSKDRADAELAKIAGRLSSPSTNVAMTGKPEKCIASAASEHAVDLVLMSRASGRMQAVYHDDLPRILRKLRCPVLTIPVDARPSVVVMNKIRAKLGTSRMNAAVLEFQPRVHGSREVVEVPVGTRNRRRG